MAVRKRKEPIHQIFYLCSSYTPDLAWKEFLKDCSFGKFPTGVRFENGAIKCNRKKHVFTQPLPSDAEQALSVIIEVFRDKLGIKTVKEKNSASAKFDKSRHAARIVTWKDATTIASRNCLIRNFASRFSTYYILNPDEQNNLVLLLSIAVSTKILDANTIHLVDGKIARIDGLHFDPLTRKTTLDGTLTKQPLTVHPVPLDYKPTPQINHPVAYSGLLDHHIAKMHKATTTVE
jgi:hypothetical protein